MKEIQKQISSGNEMRRKEKQSNMNVFEVEKFGRRRY